MSSASYAAWAKFDVDKELERVDEEEQRETQYKQQHKQVQAKEKIESSATQAAQQSADILAAQAAVAALKAKKKTRNRNVHEDDDVTVATDGETEMVAKLQTQAKLLASKHELLQQIMEKRRLGDRIVAGEHKKWHEAKRAFEVALSATKKLEELTPALLQVEEDQVQLVTAKSNLEAKAACAHENNHGKEHKCHSHGDKHTSQTPDKVLPKANDLVAILKMFYKDIYVGIGICELEEGRMAAATEAFKEVLLRDDEHLLAWLKRGKAFEAMDAPLLAMLHYNRITNLDTKHEEGKEALERVKTKLLVEGDAGSDEDKMKKAVSTCTEGRTFKEVLERIECVFQEANVLAVEAFFDYSTAKYQLVLECLEKLRAWPEMSTASKDAVGPVLRELEISCHLNIASACLEMQRSYVKGLIHCEQALELDSKRVIAYFRKGQLYHALHDYTKALECLETAKALVPADLSKELHKIVLATIIKETDKCEFDRNQYDTEHLRSLAAKSQD